jgi:hypothetical protein
MIKCIRFKSHVKGALQGFADIYVEKWDLEIFGLTLYMKDGKRWINFPGKEIEKDSETKFYPFFRFKNKNNWIEFVNQVKKAIDEYCLQNTVLDREKLTSS